MAPVGTSNWQNISYNINLVRKINPGSILDVGIGFGRWGILFREFLEIWGNGKYDGRWGRRIDGIEIFPGYIKDYHKYFYDEIYIGSAVDFLRNLKTNYDLINFGDVLEHIEKENAEEILQLAMDKSRYVLVNIPIGAHWAQKGTADNPFEEHKSIWYYRDFVKHKYYRIKSFKDFTHREFAVILLSRTKIKFNNPYGRFFSVKNILKHKLGLRKLVESYEKSKI
jgi:hypothetical protein